MRCSANQIFACWSVSNPISDRSRLGQQLFRLLMLLVVFVLPGCATYSVGISGVEHEAASRNIPGALKSLDELKLSEGDRVLHELNKGTLLRLQGDYAASNQQFDSAKRLMENLAAISVVEQAGSVVVNDTVKAYEGTNYEQLLVYAFKELNYLQSGNTDEAAVEARQFDIKQRLIADKNPSATYLSGAFVRYLNGIVYEMVGEHDSARIDYLKAVEGYKAQGGDASVPTALKADLERLENQNTKKLENQNTKKRSGRIQRSTQGKSDTRDSGEVMFILHNGLGPRLVENISSMPNPDPDNGAAILSVALPKFEQRPVPVARFELESASGSASSEVVEDINALANNSLEDRLPAITARAVARLVVKQAAAKKIKEQNSNAGNTGTAGLFMNLVADIGAVASERADTRSWSLLPGNILLARLTLSAGMHDLKVSFYDNHGNVLSTHDYAAIKVIAGQKTFVSDYYFDMPAKQSTDTAHPAPNGSSHGGAEKPEMIMTF